MIKTKNVQVIQVADQIYEHLVDARTDEMILKIQEIYENLQEQVNAKLEKWTKIKGKDLYLETQHGILFPDTRKLELTMLKGGSTFEEMIRYFGQIDTEEKRSLKAAVDANKYVLPSDFMLDGFEGATGLTKNRLYNLDFDDCPFFDNNCFRIARNRKWAYVILHDGSLYCTTNDMEYRITYSDSALKISIYDFDKELSSFDIIVKYALYPEKISDEMLQKLQVFHDISTKCEDINNLTELKKYIQDNNIEKIFDFDFRKDGIKSDLEREEIDLFSNQGTGRSLNDYFENCDYIRAHIQKYDARWYLEDSGKGHWDFWEGLHKNTSDESGSVNENSKLKTKMIRLKNAVVARNPVSDVRHNAVVAIDFGTKSTIVTVQDEDGQIIPMRVGMADYHVEPKEEHYENPTVMMFSDLDAFKTEYDKTEGRPLTNWNQICISHDAFDQMIKSEKGEDYASFITDIKQWAAGRYEDNRLIVKDRKGNRYDLNSYMEDSEEQIDIVEIYAYYIGLFVNNMHTGIYLDYILSFSETFSLGVREHIIKSFTKGIKKAIPETVFDDEKCCSEFRVREGVSEPAAYAACALEQFNIEPTDDGIFYGIFDFGGGTTDFDYGIWKYAPKDELTYNYVIKHYGSGGDKSLGGENILQLLAYYVFSDDKVGPKNSESNRSLMRKNKLAFFKPKEAEFFPGMESLNDASENAFLNTKIMMEALRPIWEEKEGKNKQDHVELKLFSEHGTEDVTLQIDTDMIQGIIRDRVEVGIRNFFEGYVQAYEQWEHKNDTPLYIFLAGNSSKSQVVQSCMKDYMKWYEEILFTKDLAEQDEEQDESYIEISLADQNEEYNGHFKLYPPLGTKEARKLQEKDEATEENETISGDETTEEDKYCMIPTGKTGVAFGLIMCREGSMIKVESDRNKDDEIKFNYYIGINYRKKFRLVFDRSVEYSKWMPFSKVSKGTETFEFYYTELPEVIYNNIEIKGNSSIYKRKCILDNIIEDACIYFQFIDPTTIEYVVAASEENLNAGTFMSKKYQIEL